MTYKEAFMQAAPRVLGTFGEMLLNLGLLLGPLALLVLAWKFIADNTKLGGLMLFLIGVVFAVTGIVWFFTVLIVLDLKGY